MAARTPARVCCKISSTMTLKDLCELGIVLACALLLTKPCGLYLEAVFTGRPHFLASALSRLEALFYRLARIDPSEEQAWTGYAAHLVVFCAFSVGFNYLIVRLQHHLPLNPQGFGALSPHLALNVAIGFITGTAWTSYGGESALSYLSQMVGLTFQNFTSAATGLCAAVALIRGLTRHRNRSDRIGQFWVDLVRAVLYVLLPICFVLALVFVSQGMIDNFLPYQEIATLEGAKQLIAQGPVASQVAIVKSSGSNGEGFFNANAAHPYENPTALAGFIQLLAMLLLPCGLIYKLGRAARAPRHAWSVWLALAALLTAGTAACTWAERSGNPRLLVAARAPRPRPTTRAKRPVLASANRRFSRRSPPTRSTGATNAALDSFTPLGGLSCP